MTCFTSYCLIHVYVKRVHSTCVCVFGTAESDRRRLFGDDADLPITTEQLLVASATLQSKLDVSDSHLPDGSSLHVYVSRRNLFTCVL